MDRRTLGGWLSGPGSGLPATQDFRGERLGLPAQGAGSVAGLGRRLGALTIDWFAAVFISRLVFPGVDYATEASSWLVLLVFFVVVTILVSIAGTTLGMRLLGIRVIRLAAAGAATDGRVGVLWSAVRTFLLCLVIPAVVFDRDQRGLHDRAARTVVVRAR